MARWQRNLLIVLGIMAALVILPGIPWMYCDVKYGRELRRELDRLRAAGEPLSLVEAAPKPVPAYQNAAPLYMQVFHVNFDPAQPIWNERFSERGLSKYDVPSEWKSGQWDTAELMRPVLALPGCQEALRVIRQGSLRPHCVFPVDWKGGAAILFPHMAQFRQATRLCNAQAMLDARAGDLAAAVDWLGVGYRMANHAAQEPTLIAQLVAIAIMAIVNRTAEGLLSEYDLPPGLARELRHHAATLDLPASFHRAMIGERAMGLDSFAMIKQGRISAWEVAELSGTDSTGTVPLMAAMGSAFMGPYWKLEQLNYLKHMSRQIERSAQPYRLTRQSGPEIAEGFGNIMATILVPVFSKGNAKRDQALAELALLRLALDLKAYRQAQGRYPERLGPGTVPAPSDVFTDRAPLRYRRQGAGFLIWSVGQNLQDEGGQRRQPGQEGDAYDIVWECRR